MIQIALPLLLQITLGLMVLGACFLVGAYYELGRIGSKMTKLTDALQSLKNERRELAEVDQRSTLELFTCKIDRETASVRNTLIDHGMMLKHLDERTMLQQESITRLTAISGQVTATIEAMQDNDDKLVLLSKTMHDYEDARS